jgi:hypothetical protein
MLTVINVLNALGDETAAGEGEAALTSIPAPRAQPSAAPLPSPAPAFDVPLRTAWPAAAATAEPAWPGPVEAPPAASLAEARTPHEELDWTSLDLDDVLPDLARDVADSCIRAEKESGSGHPYLALVRFGRFW